MRKGLGRFVGKLFGKISHDIGIDLGTANTLVYVRGRGIVIQEPSVVAVNKRTKEILAIGEEAKRMVGRTPSHIVAVRPLVDGVISDFEITEQMLRYFFDRVHREKFTLMPRPRVVIGIPHSVTEVERRAVEEGAINAGAREVYLIEEPIAAAIGARLPIQEASGSMIIDIGGGTTEVAVMALGGVVASRSLRVAGDEMNEDIVQYVRDRFNLMIGERTAEETKIAIGSAIELKERIEAPIRGRDLVTGLPKEIVVNDSQIREALRKSVGTIMESIRVTMEETPPELLADIMERGIVLAGGGALLRGLDRKIAEETLTAVHIADDPLTAVVRGTGIVLEDLDMLADVLLPKEFSR
ncbi:MAG: Rod shape-determining protein MreB [bacterium ADurb.Bin400]|nr:MAG: Rod shape-determining protein MreB [bacterium ADurb.Bin400]